MCLWTYALTQKKYSLYALLSSPARRYPSGNNNNTHETITIIRPPLQLSTGCVRKSSSLPNLRDGDDETQEMMILSQTQIQTELLQQQTQQLQQQQQQLQQQHHLMQQQHQQQLNVSQAITTSHMEQNLLQTKSRNLLPMCQIPISCNSTAASIEERLNLLTLQQQQHQRHTKHRCCCGGNNVATATANASAVTGSGLNNASNHSQASLASNNGSATSHHSNKSHHHHITGSTSSGSSNPPAFNLVKLFIKQKSNNCSLEDQPSAHTCMDVSSGCWPSSEANNSSSSSSLEQRLRKKSMNDSGKGSALSRHDEEADNTTSTFHMDASSASTPKKQQGRSSSLFYEEDPSSSSTGSLTATNSPAHRRRSMPLRNPALQQLALQLNANNNSSAASLLSSDNTSEQLTQVHLSAEAHESSSSSAKLAEERNKQRRSRNASRPISNASSSEMITRSMQTSCGSLSTRSSLSDRFRFVPPSFLEKLNNLGEENQAPIYVIYPNYALPDLGFVKTSATPDVIFSPFNYKMNMGSGSANSSCSSLKKRFSLMSGSDEDEILKTMDYKHVVDWQSLATLLPGDYRRRLKHIPEVNGLLSHLERELCQKPLFCLTPTVRRNRSHICDCNQYFQREQQQQQHTQQQTEAGSSSSGSSQQPSSGYRGSSTLLTDSEFENVNQNSSGDNLKQMYVYQYEQQRMDSGVEMSPKVQSATPTPMPRGILRKSSSAARSKRNSMIEQDTKLTKLEKRRSLQEPPYHYIGSAEELAEVFEEETSEVYTLPPPRTERLSRKDLDARARAENFLSSLPRNELKYYAEIASILESSEQQVQYDAAALKKEVSRALSQQKKVSFNDKDEAEEYGQNTLHHLNQETKQRFSTPPNSPNISMANNGNNANNNMALRLQQQQQGSSGVLTPPLAANRRCSKRDELEKQKLESNRFKRLQIQWELMSKDSSMLKELAQAEQTKSGGSTPTSALAAANAAAAAAAQKSRIPRPVSYPAGK